MTETDYVHISEAMKILGISKQAVHYLIKKKWLKDIKKISPRIILIRKDKVEEYKSERRSRLKKQLKNLS